MLEAGAKIYVCRVDKTKNSVMDLASTLNMQQRTAMRRRNDDTADDNEGPSGDQEMENDGEDNENQAAKAKNKRPRKKKMRGNQFIAEDVSKISLSVEPDSCKGGARRAALKIKFQDLIENDIDFDYFNEYLAKVGSVQPNLEVENNNLGEEKLVVSTAIVNISEFANLQHLPFYLIENFDKSVYNVWVCSTML
jgi:hypothetical protein